MPVNVNGEPHGWGSARGWGWGWGWLIMVASCAVACGNASSDVGNVASGGSASTVTATCDANQAKFSYDGGAEQSYAIKGWPSLYGADKGTASRIYDRFGLGQYDVVFEPQYDTASQTLPGVISDSKPWPIRSALFADATEQALGPMRCVAPGSGSTLARTGGQLTFDLKQVDVIAACADHPLDGQINLCFAFEGCPGFDGGTVQGTPWVLQPDQWVGGSGAWQVDFQDGSYLRARTTASTTGPAYWALIVTSESGPYGGQVFCASGGSVEKTPGDFGYSVMHWTNLGAVSCAAGSGTAQGCLEGGAL